MTARRRALRPTALLCAAAVAFIATACGGSGMPEGPVVVELTGIDHEWYVRYPGVDGVLGTDDDRYGTRDVLLPTGAPVTLRLDSLDYTYFFRVPEVGLLEAAMPGAGLTLALTTTAEADLALDMDTMCGLPVPEVERYVRVLSQTEFLRRMSELPTTDEAMSTAAAAVDMLEPDTDFAQRLSGGAP